MRTGTASERGGHEGHAPRRQPGDGRSRFRSRLLMLLPAALLAAVLVVPTEASAQAQGGDDDATGAVGGAAAVAVASATRAAASDATFHAAVGRLAIRNAGVESGGVALVGSSSFERWARRAASDFERATSGAIRPGEVADWGIGGSTSLQWSDGSYLDAIARTQPAVVCVYGANRLVESPRDAEAGDELVGRAISETMEVIDGLRERIPDVRVVLVSSVCSPGYYCL